MKFIYILLLGLPFFANSQSYQVNSPDKNIAITFNLNKGTPTYNVVVNGTKIIQNSKLGLKLNTAFADEFKALKSSSKEFTENYEMKWWKNKNIQNHYNELTVSLEDVSENPKKLNIIFRAYNDGIAFRYGVPKQENLSEFSIEKDYSEFSFTDDFTWWSANAERDNLGPLSINAAVTIESSIHTPLVLQASKNLYLAIHEAGIYDFSNFKLRKNGKPDTFQCEVQGASKAKTGMKTSWRTLFIGTSPGMLVESNLLVNLNPPSKIEDTSWIKSGVSMWDWRVWGFKNKDGFTYGLNTPSHKKLIDFASKNNVDFLLMDADWYGPEFSDNSDPTKSNKEINIEENLRYAKEKGVGIILYLNDIGAKKFGMERVLKQFSDWGAVGVKYGFMTSGGQEKVLQTRKVIELCAKYKLMVNFHDSPIPPSGDERTWPNTFTREYCHSQADAKYSYYPETVVSQAFINMISGPIDMCNGWYGFEGNEVRPRVFKFIPGTVAAENAKLVVIFSGLSVLPDAPENYNEKADLFDFVKHIPNQFDEYKVLGGDIESYISVARRQGKNWFVGSLTTREPRTITLNFNFLEPNTKYKAFLYEDAPDTHYINNREAYTTQELVVNSKTILELKLASGGGNAIRIVPIK
ncbi:glycoside hydrolase family 97 catalytic domain-containing protein [Polaribacter haliotis]|uniref:Glycoside hydrolase family 97 catalytic domain-containing protein n=1 Tax=Polaribacter haliotis TaxID=1888915 RepID=A0A7L8AIN6_9FLAO|nr:glycoside hydrolase family 97 protein [Polaribacter haliotis]QOD61814.1 glycoside hydrolase family 97 catalytic domain-containing protein [Polaribacter haliotis]